MLPNRPEFIEANAAAMRVGATVSFVNPRAPAADAHAIFERTKADVVVTHRDDLGDETGVLRVGDDYEDAIASAPDAEPVVDRKAQSKVVVFTSGTTGRPKGAVRSLEQSASMSGLMLGFLRTIPYRTSDVHMVVCPLYHSSGSGFATVAQALGNTMVIVEKFSPETFCRHGPGAQGDDDDRRPDDAPPDRVVARGEETTTCRACASSCAPDRRCARRSVRRRASCSAT